MGYLAMACQSTGRNSILTEDSFGIMYADDFVGDLWRVTDVNASTRAYANAPIRGTDSKLGWWVFSLEEALICFVSEQPVLSLSSYIVSTTLCC